MQAIEILRSEQDEEITSVILTEGGKSAEGTMTSSVTSTVIGATR
jgi:hypothetical protein